MSARALDAASHNPQTYQQALLLLAQLGPLVPDQLVHNVMPIFTFMGANVLQRDDAYSLRVVEKVRTDVFCHGWYLFAHTSV